MGLDTGGLAVIGTGVVGVVAATLVGYALRGRVVGGDSDPNGFHALRETVSGRECVALLLPDAPTVDSVAAAVGLGAVASHWGTATRVVALGDGPTEDIRAFCNLFDVTVAESPPAAVDGALVVGGAGPVPSPPGMAVIGAVRHRSAPHDGPLVVTGDDGATSTTVTRLLEAEDVVPDERTASALFFGVRAGTQEFRRVHGNDFDVASFLHNYADQGRLDALRAPGMGDETFDVLGTAIANRERRATFAVANAGTVPTVSALEDATDTLLRLDGVTSAATFGVHDEAVVVSCRSDDVRESASDLLRSAFSSGTIAGSADAASARVDLGLFSRVSEENSKTLDELVDASARKALFSAFDAS